MKKLYPLLSVLFIFTSIVVGQQSTIPQYTIGFGGGLGEGGTNINMGMTLEFQDIKNKEQFYKFFMNFGSTGGILNNQNENNTYDFNENLFDDVTRSIIETYVWMTLGYVFPIKFLEFHLGGGVSGYSKYYEKYDPSEILSSNGTYYVYDEESGGFNTFTPSLGMVFNPNYDQEKGSNFFRFEGMGFSLITKPRHFSLLVWFSFLNYPLT
mgnify:CR=1 FL=1